MMQAQNAALFLGQIPNPQTGKPEVNLQVARMFIDQLAMIQEKTRGNLTSEEITVLRNALSGLQMAFVEASQGGSVSTPGDQSAPETGESSSASESAAPTSESTSPAPESDSRKKFTKTYGA